MMRHLNLLLCLFAVALCTTTANAGPLAGWDEWANDGGGTGPYNRTALVTQNLPT